MLNLDPIYDLIVPPGTKGFPLTTGPIRLGDIAAAGWRLHDDLQMPVAVLRRTALNNNGQWMRRFTEAFGVGICPHGKTTMAPQLFDRQLRDGAWGITCATIAHLKVYRHFGVGRVIFANQICSSEAALWLARELARDASFEAFIFVDSVAGADLLAGAAREVELDRPIRVLLETGRAGIRTGVRGVDAALRLAEHIHSLKPHLALAGAATFEGVIPGDNDIAIEKAVAELLSDMIGAAERIDQAGLFADGPLVLTAGGSKYFDIVADKLRAARLSREFEVVLRSGCYLSHDANEYEAAFERLKARGIGEDVAGGLRNALEVWGEVQSQPEATLLLANLGKRDLSFDHGLPRVIQTRCRSESTAMPDMLRVERLSDQHAHISLSDTTRLEVGDRLAFGVSHPCTTFDKWRYLFELDDEDRVVDVIATCF